MKRAESILKTATVIFALHACAIGTWAAPCAARQQIHSRLNAALREQILAGVRIPDAGEIACPSVLTGTELLVVASVRRDRLLHSLAARFECTRGGCLPFVVRIAVPQDVRVAESKRDPNRSKPLPARMTNQRFPSAAHSLVRPGEIVTLLWEEGPMRLTRTMVCLDHGDMGQTVRTRAREGGRVVRAHVLAAGLVKAEL